MISVEVFAGLSHEVINTGNEEATNQLKDVFEDLGKPLYKPFKAYFIMARHYDFTELLDQFEQCTGLPIDFLTERDYLQFCRGLRYDSRGFYTASSKEELIYNIYTRAIHWSETSANRHVAISNYNGLMKSLIERNSLQDKFIFIENKNRYVLLK